MREAFRKKLLIVVSVFALLISLFSLEVVERNCRDHTYNMFKEAYRDVARTLVVSDRSAYETRSNILHSFLSSLDTVSEVIDSFPSVITRDNKVFGRLCGALGVERIDIVDSNRAVVVLSSDPILNGQNINIEKRAPNDPKSEFTNYVNSLRGYRLVDNVVDREGKELLLFYKALKKHPGLMVRLAFDDTSLKRTFDVVGDESISGSMSIGETGGIDIVSDGVIKNSLKGSLIGLSAGKVYKNVVDLEGLKDVFQLADRDGKKVYCSVFAFAQGSAQEEYFLVCYMEVKEVYATRRAVLGSMIFSYLILFVAIFISTSRLVKVIMLDGLERINDSLAKIETGDLNVKVKENSYPELSALSQGINSTVDALKHFMECQRAYDVEQMELARKIQLSCLPKYFPTYPELRSLNLFAMTEPAQEVGGDFYDYFRINDELYGIMIADVSEHGIPAALVMMNVKTAIRDAILAGESLEHSMESVNFSLCENNGTAMFVTAFVATMNVKTGEFRFVNAGHCRPLLRRCGEIWHEEKIDTCFVLGGIDNLNYTSESWILNPGDRVFLYTDGVTETYNDKKEMFGVGSLQIILNRPECDDYDVSSLVNLVQDELIKFSGDEDPVDDVTMLAFEYLGQREDRRFLQIKAQNDQLDKVIDFVNEIISEANLSEEELNKLKEVVDIVVDDVFTNIVSYSGLAKEEMITVRAEVQKLPQKLYLHFIDGGRPYDPTATPSPDVDLNFSERVSGGLGIHLVKSLTDGMSYRYKDGCNILRLVKNLD
ncbi:SpoIIE family protein phosphatase [bacterium]|nr:SpoIIE family protein phosphatase [bacterium]